MATLNAERPADQLAQLIDSPGTLLATGSNEAQLDEEQARAALEIGSTTPVVGVRARSGVGKTTLTITTCFALAAERGTAVLFIVPTRPMVTSLRKRLTIAEEMGRAFFYSSDIDDSGRFYRLRKGLRCSEGGVVIICTADQVTMTTSLTLAAQDAVFVGFVLDEGRCLRKDESFRHSVLSLPSFYHHLCALADKRGQERPRLVFISGTISISELRGLADLYFPALPVPSPPPSLSPAVTDSIQPRPCLVSCAETTTGSHFLTVIGENLQAKPRRATLSLTKRAGGMGDDVEGRREQLARAVISGLGAIKAMSTGGSGIIFAPTRNDCDFMQTKIAKLTKLPTSVRVLAVSSKADEADRAAVLDALVSGTSGNPHLRVIAVATEILGMGIDSRH